MRETILIVVATLGYILAFLLGVGWERAKPKPEMHRPICSIPERQWEGIKECRSKCYWQDRMEKVK